MPERGRLSGCLPSLFSFSGDGRHPICTNCGAVFSLEKISLSPQNLENKRSEFFLPSRSMVLKAVTGKIFGTLELRGSGIGVWPVNSLWNHG